MNIRHPCSAIVIMITCVMSVALADAPRLLPTGQLPNDVRLAPLRTLEGYFPFAPVDSLQQWKTRAEKLRRQVLLSAGLWPLPTKAALNAVIHGKVERDDYTVEKVFFESLPGHYVTGSLYRPKSIPADRKLPCVLCPHGHWPNGRFFEQNKKDLRLELATGAERWEHAARFPLQARCVQLARMGCLVFHYDMLGYADSVQFTPHTLTIPIEQLGQIKPDQFFTVDADSRLQTTFGLQTWNSVRSVDFVLSLPEVDPARIAVTGASGGGTQAMILSAIDERVAAAFPCVMISTAMQGGCTCENGHYLRIGMGNIEIAALTAPRPLGMTAADDWTKELKAKGYPDLKHVYEIFGQPDRLTATFNVHFGHNYNHVSRCTMYGFMSRHFGLGFDEPVLERDFAPLSIPEMSVWNDEHPRPAGDAVGPSHERAVRMWMTADADAQLAKTISTERVDLDRLRSTVGEAWRTMIGRDLPVSTDIGFKLIDKADKGAYQQMTGLVRNLSAGEELPALTFYPHSWNGEVVLWISPEGKSSLFDAAGQLISPVQRLLDAQSAVVTADLFGQGEFTAEGKPATENRLLTMFDPKLAEGAYAPFTYGYNPPLFSQRVHDLLTLVSFIRNHDRAPRRVFVVGLAGAGPWVAAARAIAGCAIDRAAVETAGFHFANLVTQRDIQFLPGALKYGDLPVLLALSSPQPLWLSGENADRAALIRAAYRTAGAEGNLTIADPKSGDGTAAMVDWLMKHDP